MHSCPITLETGQQCPVSQVPDDQLMCSGHWALVPQMLQRELYRAWARGAGAGSEHHTAAMQACIEVVDERLRPKAPPLFDTDLAPAVVPPGYDTAPCGGANQAKGCGHLILWATQVDGYGKVKVHEDGPRKGRPKRIPLNLRAHPDGKWKLTGHGKARIIARSEMVLPRERYMAHHATCPERAAFRQRQQLTVLPGGGGS